MSKIMENDMEDVNEDSESSLTREDTKADGTPNGTKTTGTSIGGPKKEIATSNGGTKTTTVGAKNARTSIGGAKTAGTSIGGGPKPAGTSIGGGGAKTAGTSIGGGGAKTAGTSIGGGGVKTAGTSIGGGGAKTAGTSIGGGGAKTAGTSIGGGGAKPAGTSIGGGGVKTAGTSIGGGPKPAGTSIGGGPKPAGTSIGGGVKTAGTSIGGGPKPAGTSIGGGVKPAGTSIGGDLKSSGTSIGGGSDPESPRGEEAGMSEESEVVSPPATPGGTKTAGTSIGGGGGPKPAGTSIGGGPKPAATSIGGGGAKTAGTSIGGGPKPTGTSVGGGVKPAQKNPETPSEQPEQEEEGEDDDGETEDTVGKKKQHKKKGAAAQTDTQPSEGVKPQVPPTKQPPKGKGPAAAAARQIKKMQEEQERIRREEEELRRKEEEEERLRIEKEKKAEEERKLKAEEKKKAREELRERQLKAEAQKKREEAIWKYGFDPTQNVAQRGGGGRRGGRDRGGRAGRGGRDRGGREGQNQKPQEETKSPQKEAEPEQSTPGIPKKQTTEIENWEEEPEDTWENSAKPEEDNGEQLDDSPKVPEKSVVTTPIPKPDPEPERVKIENDKARRREEETKKKLENLEKKKVSYRSPICCVLGHVDTGKTLLLDKMRSSSVQAGEAGGITQQIGATFFPMSMIREMTIRVEENMKKTLTWKLPGLLVIDTPGHESFTNLRSRGSSLCDIAILVVDMMHGLEPQTRESINLLKKRRTPFVIALNKVDRLVGWKPIPGAAINQSLQAQSPSTRLAYDDRVKSTIADLAGEGLNSELYYQNKELRKVISLVPTSAVTGEGLPDLLLLLVQLSQNLMADKLLELSSLCCTVLEVKKLTGHGTTLDVVLANGVLKQGDKIVVCGLNGEPIITSIKTILLPPPATELRVKSDYINEKIVRASIGCKIDAPGLEDAVAGSPLFVINPGDSVAVIEEYKEKVTGALNYLEGKIDRSGVGVYVQASTLGSMEALLEFLKEDCNIPVSGIRIGDVHKRDVMRASIMLEKNKPEYAVILAFDVKVTAEAAQVAKQLRVRMLEANIIYHLFQQFTDYLEEIKKKRLGEYKGLIVFPCILRILGKETVFNKHDPIICGVKVEEGILKIGTPIVIFATEDKENKMLELGTITKIERERGVELQEAKVGDDVSICITVTDEKKQRYMFGRHFDETNLLYSQITRETIDGLKEFHKELVKQKEIYYCIVNLKKVLNIS